MSDEMKGAIFLDDLAPDADEIFTIGRLAREFKVTLRTIRFYETKGLLTPQREGKTRLYRAEDRRRLALILKGKHLGFTLSEIRALIASKIDSDATEGVTATLGLTREQCLRQIATLERQKRDVETALSELRRAYAAAIDDRDAACKTACS